MLLDVLPLVSFFRLLHRIDQDLAERCKAARCVYCGGPLHDAHYERKPRGGPPDLPDELSIRYGLCCGREGCRRRILPPSALYFGRRVYWGAVVIVLTAILQGRDRGHSYSSLQRRFGSLSRLTLKRWQAWFAEELRQTRIWQSICGSLPLDALDGDQPSALLESLVTAEEDTGRGVTICLSLLSGGPLSVAQARMVRG